jgi:phage terminase small subunit
MTYSDAYKNAYNTEKMKSTTITEKASRLASQGNIRARIDKEKERLADKQIWSREEALSSLAFIVDKAKKQIEENETFDAATANSMTKAIEQANKMCGYNEPEKISISQEEAFKVDIKVID